MGVIIRPSKASITAGNKDYQQALDVLYMVDKTSMDGEHPYEIMVTKYYRGRNKN